MKFLFPVCVVGVAISAAACSGSPASPSPQFIPAGAAYAPVVINGQTWCGSKDGHLIDCAGNPIVLPTK